MHVRPQNANQNETLSFSFWTLNEFRRLFEIEIFITCFLSAYAELRIFQVFTNSLQSSLYKVFLGE